MKKSVRSFLELPTYKEGVVNWDTVPYCIISDKEIEKYRLVSGDIVVARTGNSTGENYIFTEEVIEGVFASFMIRFRVDPKIVLPKFVWYAMRSYYWFSYIDAIASGAAQREQMLEFWKFHILLSKKRNTRSDCAKPVSN